METFTEFEFREKLEPIYRAVFARDDPYDAPFQPEIQPRLLLYSYRWSLEEPWVNPLVKTLRQLGEAGFFVSSLHRPKPEEQAQPYHWYVSLDEARDYGNLVFSQENAIYSTDSRWGIICSDEDHALLGGPDILIANIRNSVQDLEYRVNEFLEVWKYYHERNKISLTWLPGMLLHIFGTEKTTQLLRQAQLNWLLPKKG